MCQDGGQQALSVKEQTGNISGHVVSVPPFTCAVVAWKLPETRRQTAVPVRQENVMDLQLGFHVITTSPDNSFCFCRSFFELF